MEGIIDTALLTLLSAVLLSGCATYHISTQDMLQQFADVHKETKILNTAFIGNRFFFFFTSKVDGNSLRTIQVQKEDGTPYTLKVDRATSVRITTNEGKKTTFYFNTLLLQDSTITGSKTHFFEARIKPIPFSDISKIELQKH